ncbi:MAG: hypothetical protein CMD16_03125, partial [Flavobacteriales bacterium]|nr:hypothetical protein [Flavobacteriales bacterium]
FDITSSGGTSTQNLANGVSSYSFINLCADNYDIVVTDANGCSTSPSTTPFNIAPIAPIVPGGAVTVFNLNGYHVSCYGAADGSIIASATGGTGVFTYSLDGINYQPSNIFSGLTAGIYDVYYKDANGCIASEQLTLNEPPNLSGSASVTQLVDCYGANTGEITLTVDPLNPGVPVYQYSIDNGASYQGSNIFSGLFGDITYDLIIEDNNGCQYSSIIYLSEPIELNVVSSVFDASCYGLSDGIVTLNITGGVPNYTLSAFSVTLPLNSSSYTTPSGIPSGNYPFTVLDANNCPFNDIVTVAEPALISSIDNVVSCGSYDWIDGNTYTANNNTATYTLPATNGCDSIVFLNLSLTPDITNTVVDTACGEYLFGSTLLDVSGMYLDTFIATGGCDSVVTLQLTIFEDSSVTYITECDSAEWNGVWYYHDTIITTTGLITTNTFTGASSLNNTCPLDIAIGLDLSGSNSWTGGNVTGNSFTSSFLTAMDARMDGSISGVTGANDVQIGLYTWTSLDGNCSGSIGSNVQVSPMSTNTSLLNSFTQMGGGFGEPVFGGDEYDAAVPIGLNCLNDYASSSLGDRTGTSSFYRRIMIILTDASNSSACFSNDCFSQNMAANIWGLGIETIAVKLEATDQINMNISATDPEAPVVSCIVQSLDDAYRAGPNQGSILGSQIANSICVDPPAGCDSVATAIITIKNSSSTYNQVAQCDSFTWALNGQTYYNSEIDTIQSINIDGCQHIDSLDLTIYPEINVSAIITDELCVNYSDGSITLNVTGGLGTFSYNWIGPSLFSETTKDIFNLSPGSYVLTITDLTTLCTKDTSFVVGAGFDMQVNVSVVDISCYNLDDGTIDITPVNLINPIYSWSDTVISLEDRADMSPGVYYLQIDDNNCFLRDTFVFHQPDSLFIISQQTSSVCVGGNSGEISVQVFGGTPFVGGAGYSYYWSNWSGNNADNLNLSPGTYDLDVYDANGCLYEETFIIQSYQINVSSNINNIDCFSDSTGSIDLTITGGFSPYYYLWSDGADTEDVYNLSEGSINCTISDYFGCVSVETFVLTQETPIQVIETINNISCYGGNNGSVSLNISGGVSPYNIDWYNVDENNLFEGTYDYEVIDANGCMYNDNVYISQEDTLDVIINVLDLSCPAEPNGEISIYILSGGVSPYSFSWTGPNSFNSFDQDINDLYAGLYNLELTDANGCSFDYQITVSEPIALSQNVDIEVSTYSIYNISCYGGNDGFISVSPNGGYVPYQFLWSTGNQTNSIDYLTSGIYTLTITNGIGCQEEFLFNLLEPAEPLSVTLTSLYDYNGFDVSCFGGNDGAIYVDADGGVEPYSYYWNNQSGEDISGSNPHAFIEAGLYNLELVDNNGCPYFDAIILEQPDPLEWVINISPDTCEKGVGMVDVNLLGGIPPYLYDWNNTEYLPLAVSVVEGEYFLVFEDANYCVSKDTIVVENLSSPDMDFDIMSDYERLYEQKRNPIVFIDMTELSWQNAYSWDWDYGDGNFGSDSISFHSYDDIGVYYVTLTVTTDYNCVDTLTKKVVVEEYDIHIPNAFTPNTNDNFNNGFRPYGIGIDEFLMKIYTRWGGLVYSTDNIEEEWNGRYKNVDEECQIGVYVYYIEVKDIFGAIHKYEGQLNLIR